MNILLTGGRAPAALELARAFHRAGYTVFMAESLRGHLSQPSNAIKANFVVPAPRQEKDAFLAALKKIIIENKIDLLIPTCEEVFYIAMGRREIPCAVFVEPIGKLNMIHNKWAFVANAAEHELSIPETMLINTMDDLLHAYAHWKELVFKPVYSRFAARTLILPPLKQASSTLIFDPASPWIAQGFIKGKEFCAYSVCHNGRITAHTAYPSVFTAGQGAAIVFRHIAHPAIFEWMKTFVEKNQFSGQIAFDFIETPNGQIYALECNPRATSGVHLLASHPQFIESFLNPQMDCITPSIDHSYMLTTAMLIYGLPAALRKKQFLNWLRTFFTSSDAILDFKDPLPFLLQFRSIFSYLKIARSQGISPLEASTFDIEWNGGNE
jgi:predicted ATP-grasp superfamily ATP-dependent carboligase